MNHWQRKLWLLRLKLLLKLAGLTAALYAVVVGLLAG